MALANAPLGDGIGQPATTVDDRGPRPREVRMVSILLMVFGVLGTVIAGLLLGVLIDDASHGQSISGIAYAIAAAAVALGVLQVVSGVFVFRGQEWARKVAIGICVLNGISGLLTLASGAGFQAIVGVIVNIALIVNLAKYEVSSWCR